MRTKTTTNYMFITFFFLLGFCFSIVVTAFAGISDKAISELKTKERSKEKEGVNRPQVEYVCERIKDPFQANIIRTVSSEVPQPEDITPPSVEIQGIIWGGDVPQAIIDNTVVRPGDTVQGDIRIISINKEGVAVFYNNQRFMLSSPAIINLQELEEKRRQ